MEIPESTRQQYSTVKEAKEIQYSTVTVEELLKNISDVIHEGYEPFYAKQYQRLGYARFMELVSKARAGSDTPDRLFSWMLKNDRLVK